MIYYFATSNNLLSLLQNINIRSVIAALCSLFIAIFCAPFIIQILKKHQTEGQPIRHDGPQTHKEKAGTPTMGGIIIILASLLSCALFCNMTNPLVLTALGVFVFFGILGFLDDYLKVIKKDHKGVRPRHKFMAQIALSIVIYLIISHLSDCDCNKVFIPACKDLYIDLGILFLPFIVLVITGSSNAVNLTDGLDGLAIVPVCITLSCYAYIAYCISISSPSDIFPLPIQYLAELSVLCAAVIGSGIGFLWFNAKPAQIFMGDTGSLALGGLIGTLSIMTKQELLLVLIGGVFVAEALSVIVQVVYFKSTKGKRIFKMAPLHHHYEQSGMSETKVVARFWIAALVCAAVGMLIYFL